MPSDFILSSYAYPRADSGDISYSNLSLALKRELQTSSEGSECETVQEQNLFNAGAFKTNFNLYNTYQDSVFLEKRGKNGKKSFLKSHELGICSFARAEIYWPFANGGMLAAGSFNDFINGLRTIPGAHDERRQEFMDFSHSLTEKTRRELAVAESEKRLSSRVFRTVMYISLCVSREQILIDCETPFAAGGIVPVIKKNRRGLCDSSGVVGKGRFALCSAITGELKVALEFKLSEVRGDFLQDDYAQNIFIQGISFMCGRNLDFLLLMNRGGFIAIWRKLLTYSGSLAKYQYFMWPERKYANFDDDQNLGLLHEILAELARISAIKDIVAPESVKNGVRLSATQSPANKTQNSRLNHDSSWLAATSGDDFLLTSYNVGFHLTPEELEKLLDHKRISVESESDCDLMSVSGSISST